MKEASKLASFDDKPPKDPLIHEDFDKIEKLISEFNETFAKAEE